MSRRDSRGSRTMAAGHGRRPYRGTGEALKAPCAVNERAEDRMSVPQGCEENRAPSERSINTVGVFIDREAPHETAPKRAVGAR